MLRAASEQSEGVDFKASLDCLEECVSGNSRECADAQVRLMSHHGELCYRIS